MSIFTFANDIASFTQAKTLNQLKFAIETHLDELKVHIVSQACHSLVLLSNDDRFYIDVQLDRENPYFNRVRIYDRHNEVDHENKNKINGHGYQKMTGFLFSLKQQAWEVL
jgi:uncharacterized protein YdcH (DUF465 family)